MLLLWLKALLVQGRLSEMRVEVLLDQGFTTTSIAHSCKASILVVKLALLPRAEASLKLRKYI